jgi:response regulator RpfG family c-di-GMP phosphodiesterase
VNRREAGARVGKGNGQVAAGPEDATADRREPGAGELRPFPAPRLADPGPPAGVPLRVLVVDDDPLVLDFLRDVLASESCLVSATTTAEEGLELVAEHPFDLVLTDIRLPALSGLDLLRAVKARQPLTPVVLITGAPSVNSAVFALRHGALDYLRKPFSVDEVQQLVRSVADTRRHPPGDVPAPARRADEQTRQQLGVEALFRIGELGLQGLDPEPYLDGVLAFVVQGLRSDAAIAVLRDEASTLWQRGRGEPGLVTQLLGLTEGAVAPLAGIAGREALSLTGPRDRLAVIAAGVPEPGGGLTLLAVGRDVRHGAFLPGEHELLLRYAQAVAIALRPERDDAGEDVFIDTISFLTTVLESKDPALKGHSARVSLYSGELAAAMGLPRSEVAVIRRAGLLHDLGKLMVLDAILLKPEPLTPEELAVVRRHPLVGGRILRRLRHFEREAEAVEHHLERFDGTGHPDAQRGEDIPLAARIVAVADAFDAMTSPRPYRQPQSLEAALDELTRGAGGQFDPRLVGAFVGLPAARLHEISRYYRNRPAVPEADPGADQPSFLPVARGSHDPIDQLPSAVTGGLGWVKLIEDPREDDA